MVFIKNRFVVFIKVMIINKRVELGFVVTKVLCDLLTLLFLPIKRKFPIFDSSIVRSFSPSFAFDSISKIKKK